MVVNNRGVSPGMCIVAGRVQLCTGIVDDPFLLWGWKLKGTCAYKWGLLGIGYSSLGVFPCVIRVLGSNIHRVVCRRLSLLKIDSLKRFRYKRHINLHIFIIIAYTLTRYAHIKDIKVIQIRELHKDILICRTKLFLEANLI